MKHIKNVNHHFLVVRIQVILPKVGRIGLPLTFVAWVLTFINIVLLSMMKALTLFDADTHL